MERYLAAARTCADLVWRWKSGEKRLPARALEVLPDGSGLVVMRESDGDALSLSSLGPVALPVVARRVLGIDLSRHAVLRALLRIALGLAGCARRLGLAMNMVKLYVRAEEPGKLRRAAQFQPTVAPTCWSATSTRAGRRAPVAPVTAQGRPAPAQQAGKP